MSCNNSALRERGLADRSSIITSTVLWHIATPILKVWYKEVAARGKQQNSPLDPISIVSTPTRGRELFASGSVSLDKKENLRFVEMHGDSGDRLRIGLNLSAGCTVIYPSP
jgi:hypothetical protein